VGEDRSENSNYMRLIGLDARGRRGLFFYQIDEELIEI
jgi:hypothetical protein